MFTLLNNSCVSRIQYDINSGDNFGKIFFVDGEIYTGEIFDNSPKGLGNLDLKDISSFQGSFNGKEMKEGVFAHFTGLRFEGSFKKDKFYKGTLIFQHNQKLQGEWGLKQGKWVLIKGELKEHNGKILCNFQDEREYTHKREKYTIVKNHRTFGFVVKFEQIQIQNKVFKNFALTAENMCMWEYQKFGTTYRKEISYSKIPYLRIQKKDVQDFLDQSVRFGFGISLEIKDQTTLKFNSMQNIYAKGEYSLNKIFSFEGILYNNSIEIGFIEIFKNSFSPIKIEFNKQKFDSVQSFENHIIQNYACSKIEQNAQKEQIEVDQIQKECIENVIKDIKQHEQCAIFQFNLIIFEILQYNINGRTKLQRINKCFEEEVGFIGELNLCFQSLY